jgi:SAM-dependent methyltransferase
MPLRPDQRTKLDNTDDRQFYVYPRLVTHVDEGFIRQLTDLYRERLKPDTQILDMMSSWVSHLPNEMKFARVEGHGLNGEELAKNPRLDSYVVQNLNADPKLPFTDSHFDAVLNCVSVQYLQYPEAVFAEIYRILKPGGVAIFSFSNRMFYDKAIQAWREGSETSRVELVKSYFQSVPGFSAPEVVSRQSNAPNLLQWLGAGGGDPFYAVIAYKS